MQKRKILFLLIVLLLFLCTCFLGACSKESAVVQPNDSTKASNSMEPDSSTAPENSSVEPDSSAADKNTLPSESASPEPKADENQTKPDKEQTMPDAEEPLTWQSAYVEIICHVEDYLAPVVSSPYEGDERENLKLYNPNNKVGYVGIHDFDGDGIPELLAGDDLGMGVFTFAEGKAEKLADLYWPDIVWCINGVYVKDNGISLECDGSTGSWFVCFGFVEGEYRLGRYYEYAESPELTGDLITDVTLNGEPSTPEEMDKIYNTNWSERDRETEYKKRIKIINKDGTWVLQDWWTKEEVTLDQDFDFELVRW